MKTDPNPLHDALAELATTMSPNPDRLRQVRQRVARRRRQRMAAGAAVSVGAVAGAVGIALVPREPGASVQFAAGPSSLPACASVPAPAMASPEKTVGQNSEAPAVDLVVRYKGMAVITAVGTGTLTLGEFSDPGALPPADSVVVVVDSATRFENDGLTAAAADAHAGQRVIFAASVGADGANHLDHVELGVEATPPAESKESDAVDAKKSAVAPDSTPEAPSDGVLWGKDVLAAAAVDNTVVVQSPVGNAPTTIRLVVGSATQYFRHEVPCANPELVAGTVMMYAAVPNGDGSYTANEIHIYN